MAWLPGWDKRVKLTIDQNDIDEALSDFPILVYLSASSGRNADDVSFIFDELEIDANRKKIAVTTSDGQTQCYVEIEKWDDANEKAWLWVKVPSVASGADTDLYLYYDKTKADNTTYVGDVNSIPGAAVWDSNYVLVCHMRDDPDTSHTRDSTQYDNDGTKTAPGQPVLTANGQIGEAQSFDGANDYVDHGNKAILSFTSSPFTIEAMIKCTDFVIENAIFQNGSWVDSGYFFQTTASRRLDFYTIQAGATRQRTFGIQSVVVDTDYHVAVVRNGANAVLYQDAVDVTQSHGAHVNPDAPSQNARVGERDDTGNDMAGIIDELRVSNTNRSFAWIKASYESEIDDLLDFGSEELAPLFARYIIEVHNSTGDLVAILNNAHGITYSEAINEAPTLSFSLPADDDKAVNIVKANEIWLRNYEDGTIVKKFKLSLRGDVRQ